jgi:hypothetical protein
MAIDGNWNIEARTLLGHFTGTASLKSAGGSLTGTGHAAGASAEIHDGTVSGDNFAGNISITSPISLTIHFSGKVSGNSMSGELVAGSFGSFHFTGTRH